MKDLKELTRPNIRALKPYSSARDEYSGAEASVFLDANENPYNTPNNRYPDPMQRELKNLIAPVKKVKPENIFLGNGSDEAIDLVYRAFCRPGVDNVVAIDPTYGMYQVCAEVNDVEYRKVLLDENYQFTADRLLAATDDPEEIWRYKRRIAELTPMLTQMNELAELTAHYYDRGYYRNEKYTV